MKNDMTRRKALAAISSSAVGVLAFRRSPAATTTDSPPIRTITRGPKYHWFGYYDKLEFDPTNRFVLANQVDFEHRTPRAGDVIRVGMVDTARDDKWIELGGSRAWGWQQGCMLQWRPGSTEEVAWNDREGDRHVCRVLNVTTREIRTLPRPIYALSHDGRWAITADFSRIQRMRPGYGYVGLTDPCRDKRAPDESGVWKMDMQTGDSELVFSLADAAAIDHNGQSLADRWHYFNHLLINPAGSRFIVLHRWRNSTGSGANAEPTGSFTTRMFTVSMDGAERYVLDPSGHTSHFIWRDAEHVCAWTRPGQRPSGFYLLRDQTRDIEPVGASAMTENGHNTYVPNTDQEWILNDTYPRGARREQTPYLFHVPTGRRVDLGHFQSPSPYQGEWRCDLHPRTSTDGRIVAIDSPHTGIGRQVHLIDVSKIVG